ncbi:DUF4926 domain-containing protein [Pseudodesulfovibrio sediminis]|uniref:DUF4926 domain-containing protein n=1 Tax=Pseudodesulfovibrio sediminis TaxID=2810563 RepID=A0ABM7P762_9BACT|nr:DUF4926 domain-containing protein [Pseudodesulfovibrio sediminis]BCS88788.1 hypothetical protein PSDVSF_20300 [Pseudodesulfovibrio sediminis]
MMLKIFDVVVIVRDMPLFGLIEGMIGTVVEVFTNPADAYEIEFCDKDGKTIKLCTIEENQLRDHILLIQ